MTGHFSFSYLAPVILIAMAAILQSRPGRRPGQFPRWSEYAALAALCLCGLGGVQLVIAGPGSLSLASGPAGLGVRADATALSLACLVGFIGWIVMRFSRTYLDGEAEEGAFHARMLATLAAVLIFVQAGSVWVLLLGTICISLGLRRLLLFYPDRPEARRAATKFSLVWHAGDVALALAAVLLVARFGTAEFGPLADRAAQTGLGLAGTLAAGLIVLAAGLKTAAFPFHGWLTEVMEAPTPVSALLHAGIINAGGVLLISLSGVVQLSPGVMAVLVMLGGFTALFGAAVMLTQSAVKTALAWSTVSQMGFLLLQCGLGLWALALLHILAHSLYKAHAFLSSGGAVRAVHELRQPGPVAVPNPAAVVKSFGLALLLYAVIAGLFVALFGAKTPQALALGAILIFGVAYLVAQGLADRAPAALTKRTVGASIAATVAYFTFQALAQAIWGPNLPATPVAGPLEWALIVLALASFGLVAVAQALFPLWSHHPTTAGLRVHLANGLYLNALLDRAIGGLRITGNP